MRGLRIAHGEIREPHEGKNPYIAPGFDREVETDIADWFEQYYSIRFRNYPVSESYLHESEQVACGTR